MRTNQEYKNAALAALNGNWPMAIVATFILLFLSLLSDASVEFSSSVVMQLVISGASILWLPLGVGYANAFNRLYYLSDKNLLGNLKEMTFDGFFRSLITMFLVSIIIALMTLALIVPGIIAALSLSLTPYLLKDNPELSIIETLRLSRKMMRGHKMQMICLQLSFLGWALLSMLTMGIGMLWLIPYTTTAMAAFYQDVREQYIMKEGQQGFAL